MQVEELKAEMARKNVTQKKISEIINKTESTVCKYFNIGYMPLEDAEKICDFLNLSLERRAEIFLNKK